MKKIASHRHGEGQFRREAWGPRERCSICTEYDKRLAEGQQWLAELRDKEKDKRVNALLGKEVTYA